MSDEDVRGLEREYEATPTIAYAERLLLARRRQGVDVVPTMVENIRMGRALATMVEGVDAWRLPRGADSTPAEADAYRRRQMARAYCEVVTAVDVLNALDGRHDDLGMVRTIARVFGYSVVAFGS